MRLARWLWCAGAALLAMPVAAQVPQGTSWPWVGPASAPFLPVPEIDVDPNSGTTVGLIPTWIRTDDQQAVRRIIAPDVIYNPYFGYGARARIFAYPSADTQWSVVGGGKQRVEREFDAIYESGRLRDTLWSTRLEAVYDRSGTPRFYGIGNRSPAIDQTDYTNRQVYVQALVARNVTHNLQVSYTLRVRGVDVTPGSLARIASLEQRFGNLLGAGVTQEVLNRLAVTLDTRDDPTVPSTGYLLTVYTGLAARHGFLNSSLYSEVGLDTHAYWALAAELSLAGHLSLRYLPTTHHTPFWALSSLGGDSSELDGSQPLRGFGTARFYGRNAFSTSWELRWTVAKFDAVGTHLDLQLTPFADAGRVYAHAGTSPLSQLHFVGGLGVRAVARPTVVGYVDVGYGSEGIAVFTGINYPI